MDYSKLLFLGIVLLSLTFLSTSVVSIGEAEIAVPVHCQVDCNGEDIYQAGDTLKGCFEAAASDCGAHSECGDAALGEDCGSCCESYCNNAGINSYMSGLPGVSGSLIDSAVSECKSSCFSTCERSRSILSIESLIRQVGIILAALAFALCGFRLLLADNPSTRTQEKRCLFFTAVALIVLALSSHFTGLFFSPTDESPEIKPFVDLTNASVGGPGELTVEYRVGWGSVSNLKMNITAHTLNLKGCLISVEKNIGGMDVGETGSYTGDLCGPETYVVRFTSSEGNWTYELDCSYYLEHVTSGPASCKVVKFSYAGRTSEICFDGVDNDGDGLVDEEDPDCVQEPPEGSNCSELGGSWIPADEACVGNDVTGEASDRTSHPDEICCVGEITGSFEMNYIYKSEASSHQWVCDSGCWDCTGGSCGGVNCAGDRTYCCNSSLYGELAVTQGYDYGRCGGNAQDGEGYCYYCAGGCEHVGEGGGCGTVTCSFDEPYCCRNVLGSDHSFRCVPEGFDCGCCGTLDSDKSCLRQLSGNITNYKGNDVTAGVTFEVDREADGTFDEQINLYCKERWTNTWPGSPFEYTVPARSSVNLQCTAAGMYWPPEYLGKHGWRVSGDTN